MLLKHHEVVLELKNLSTNEHTLCRYHLLSSSIDLDASAMQLMKNAIGFNIDELNYSDNDAESANLYCSIDTINQITQDQATSLMKELWETEERVYKELSQLSDETLAKEAIASIDAHDFYELLDEIDNLDKNQKIGIIQRGKPHLFHVWSRDEN